jgi:hypothetical protein
MVATAPRFSRASRAGMTALLGLTALLPLGRLAGQTPADTSTARVRAAFDFLVGSWLVVARTDASPTTSAFDETYTFTKSLNGMMITGDWRFDRGTLERPDRVTAAYHSGYDTRSRAWSFYYVSPQSAQYWPGTEVGGRWVFDRTFTLGDTTFLQRQWWEPIDANTIARHIDNSPDGGKTWRPLTIRLRRTP